jgi:hypothetical protein
MNPPTDTLYKFMAISGLIIVLTSLGYGIKEIQQLRIDVINMNTESSILNEEVDRVGKEISAMEKHQDDPNYNKNIETKLIELTEKSLMGIGKEEILNEKKFQIIIYLVLMIFINVIGSLLSFLGFRRWYLMEEKNNNS